MQGFLVNPSGSHRISWLGANAQRNLSCPLTYDVTFHFRSNYRDDDMSRKELVFIVSRAFALLLISWALADVSYIPERLFSLTHHISQGSVLARYDYWSSYYLVVTSSL